LRGTIIFTPLSALTPTPTIPAEKLFKPSVTTGQFQVELHSSSANPIGTPGDQSLQGPGDLQINPQTGAVTFSMSSNSAPELVWDFTFFAPSIRIGETYEAPRVAERNANSPTILVTSSVTEQSYCTRTSGRFSVQQQQPTIVITFFHMCDDNPNKTMEGKISFTSASQLPATATIAPDKILTNIPAEGELELEAVSEGNDPLGRGQGSIAFKGRSPFARENGVMTFEVNRIDERVETWTFSFFSPTMEIGKRNEPVAHWPNRFKRFPAMDIYFRGPEVTGSFTCNHLGGYFTIEQRSPAVVISFLYQCNRNISGIFRGKITYTPVSQLTPTPSVPPDLLLKATMTEGKAYADVTGAGTSEGSSTLLISSIGNNAMQMSITLNTSRTKRWYFTFSAPALQIGRTYTVSRFVRADYPYIPQMSSSAINSACRDASGEFRIEQYSPQVVVTFTYLCNRDPNQKFTGKVTFIPVSLLTPTPTIPPE